MVRALVPPHLTTMTTILTTNRPELKYPELYILRHGQTEWNAQGRMQGALNSPLTPQGEAEAAKQGEILQGLDLNGFHFICSPQGRAVQTAGIALARVADFVVTDPRLAEITVGEWSGLLRDDLPLEDVEDPYMAQYEAAPGGEGLAGVRVRAAAFLADLKGPAVLVTHGVTSRVLRSMVVGDAALQPSSIHGGQGVIYHLKDGVQKVLE